MDSQESDVVVVVRLNNQFRWFRCDRDLWVLDVNKWRQEFLDHGYAVPEFNDSYRFGMRVVDQDNAQVFLEKLSKHEVSRDALRLDLARRFPSASSWWDVHDLFPIAFVDFDARTVAGFYPDGVRMERYIPDGWVGRFVDFATEYPESQFPQEEKFWILGDSDLLALLNQRALERSTQRF